MNLVANASGSTEAGGSAIPGTLISSTTTGPGKYSVFVFKENGFAGKISQDFAVMATLRGSNHKNGAIRATVSAIPSLLTIKIAIGDAEKAGEDAAVPLDHGFYISVYDQNPGFQADTMVGKKRFGSMSGNNQYNLSGRNQTTRLRIPLRKRGKSFVTIQSDGESIDHLRLRSIGDRKGLRTSYVRLGGASGNVTAEIRKGGVVAPNLVPGHSVRFLARVKLKPTRKPKKRTVRYLSSSTYSETKDLGKLKIVPK